MCTPADSVFVRFERVKMTFGFAPGNGCTTLGAQLGRNDARANMDVGKCVRPGNKLEQRSEGKSRGGGRGGATDMSGR